MINCSGTDAAESDVEDGPESHVEVTKKTKKVIQDPNF